MNLISISNFCGQKPKSGTLSIIKYAPVSWISVTKWDYHSGVRLDYHASDDLLISGKSWLQMPTVIKTKSFSGITSKTNQGNSVGVSISGFIPAYNDNINQQLMLMQHLNFILLMKMEGVFFLIGAKIHPLSFTYKIGTSDRSPGTKGVNFDFVGSTLSAVRKIGL